MTDEKLIQILCGNTSFMSVMDTSEPKLDVNSVTAKSGSAINKLPRRTLHS